MGELCSCCARRPHDIDNNDAALNDDETQSMLNASQQKNIKSDGNQDDEKQFSPVNNYGSTSKTEYTTLNTEKHTTKILQAKHASFDIDKFTKRIINDNIDDNNKGIIEEEQEEQQKEQQSQPQQPQSLGIPTTSTSLTISNAGYSAINGDYRWYPYDKKWCMFSDNQDNNNNNNQHFAIDYIPIDNVYSQLNKLQSSNSSFKWDNNVSQCWIICSMTGDIIYYASPLFNKDYIPNNKSLWISVHGSNPPPEIYINLIHTTNKPDKYDNFGNVKQTNISPRLQSIFEQNGSNSNSNDDDDDGNPDGHIDDKPKMDDNENDKGVVVDDDDESNQSISDLDNI